MEPSMAEPSLCVRTGIAKSRVGDGYARVSRRVAARRHQPGRRQTSRRSGINQYFAARLDSLIRANGLMHRDVVEGLAREGVRITSPYLSQLRTGARKNPSAEVVDAFAKYFDVSVEIFYHPSQYFESRKFTSSDIILASSLFDESLSRLLRVSAGLSSSSIEKILGFANLLEQGERAGRI